MIKKILILTSLTLLVGCSHGMGGTEKIQDIQPDPEQPAIESTEGDIWFWSDKMEKIIKNAGLRVRDKKLQQYLTNISCRLSPKYCKDIRIYIVRDRVMNARMHANGAMLIQTGLLARAKNEAEIAFVVAHEMAHYIKRHSLKQQMDMIAREQATMVVSLLYLGFELYVVSQNPYYNPSHSSDVMQMIQLVALAGQMAYGRSHESESDDLGIQMVVEAGYDAKVGWQFWQYMVEEQKKLGQRTYLHYLDTHPSPPERVNALKEKVEKMSTRPEASAYEENYHRNISAHRGEWLADQIGGKHFVVSEMILNRLTDVGFKPAEVEFYKGEMNRVTRKEEDLKKAIGHYKNAIEINSMYFPPYRALGLIYYKKKVSQFRKYLAKYLQLHPNAKDKAMILSYLDQ